MKKTSQKSAIVYILSTYTSPNYIDIKCNNNTTLITLLIWFHYQVLLLNTTSVVTILIHIIGFKFFTQSPQYWLISIREFKLHTKPLRARSIYKNKSSQKQCSLLPHNLEQSTRYHHKKSSAHHVKCNIYQVLLPDYLTTKRWRGTNLPIHS